MNEQQAQIDMLRAAKARELLENSVLTEALDMIEADVVRLWGDCPARDKEGKETLWQLYKTSQKFRSILQDFVRTGEYSASMLKPEKQSPIRALFQR